jgi:ribonuclease HI
MSDIIIHFDGSCLPKNPGGTARYGYHIRNSSDELIHEDTGIAAQGPEATNNVAEWAALQNALGYVSRCRLEGTIQIYGDSALVINQLNGKWKCKKEHLQPYLEYCQRVLANRIWSADWIPREENEHADTLSRR